VDSLHRQTGGELLFEHQGLGRSDEALVPTYDVLENRVPDFQGLIKILNLVLEFLVLLLVDQNRLLIRCSDHPRISLKPRSTLMTLAVLSGGISASSLFNSHCISSSLLLDGLKVEAADVASTGMVGVNETFKFIGGEKGLDHLVVRSRPIFHTQP
jgi:hypothetical protein